jgi:hypothetical protein
VTAHFDIHPDADFLEQYAMNHLTESEAAPLEEHLLLCHTCCAALTAIDEEIDMIRLAA